MALNRHPWSGRTGLAKVDLVTRWQLYLGSAVEPLPVLFLLGSRREFPGWPDGLVLALSVAHAGACLLLLRAGIEHSSGGPRPSTAVLVTAVALTAIGPLTALLVLPDARTAAGLGVPVALVMLVFCAFFSASLTAVLPVRILPAVLVIPAVAAGLVGRTSTWALYYLLWVGTAVVTYGSSLWYLRLVAQSERSRLVEAQLAVAQERLRFARDLHDILGRNLTLIAVSSDLAVELARRGQEGAIEQMLTVRRTAQESMREMREVVGGYRAIDLQSELAGARSLLRSAGIDTRVSGESVEAIDGDLQAALAWVVREGTTNIIRHSHAGLVTLSLDVVTDPERGPTAVLQIENDGAHVTGGAPTSGGSGLDGLRERLARLGGEVSAEARSGHRFLLQARLPLEAAIRPNLAAPNLAAPPLAAEGSTA